MCNVHGYNLFGENNAIHRIDLILNRCIQRRQIAWVNLEVYIWEQAYYIREFFHALVYMPIWKEKNYHPS